MKEANKPHDYLSARECHDDNVYFTRLACLWTEEPSLTFHLPHTAPPRCTAIKWQNFSPSEETLIFNLAGCYMPCHHSPCYFFGGGGIDTEQINTTQMPLPMYVQSLFKCSKGLFMLNQMIKGFSSGGMLCSVLWEV